VSASSFVVRPIGTVESPLVDVGGVRVRVSALEAIDGTPILDIKPVLGPVVER
jgi:tRNA (Thr-GGU) A37 N-methylase